MKLSFTQVGVIAGTFIAGYGIAHIPAGWFAERFGMRAGMIFGVVVQTLGAAMSGWAPSHDLLLVGRLLYGIGGAVTMGSAVGLTAAWFRGKELATANGIIQGVGFTIAAAAGLYGWGLVVEAFGWRQALLIGAGVGVASLLFLLAFFPSRRRQGKTLSKDTTWTGTRCAGSSATGSCGSWALRCSGRMAATSALRTCWAPMPRSV